VGGLLWLNNAQSTGGMPTGIQFVAYDGNGNVAGLFSATDGSNTARYEYGPFGEPLRSTGPLATANSVRWSTKVTDDESGLVYYGFRYYRSATGRWPNRDPLGELGFELLRGKRGSLLGDGPNLYMFVRNNAVNSWDVNGLHLISDPGGIAGGIAGGIMDKLRALAKTAGGIALCRCAGCLAALNIQVYSCAWYLDGDDWARCTCQLLKESWGTKALCRTCTFGASNAVDLAREYIGCDALGEE